MILEAGNIVLDTDKRWASCDGRVLDLNSKEFDLLAYLMQHQGEILKSEDILRAVWGINVTINPFTVHVHIQQLRRWVHSDEPPDRIEVLQGGSYRFNG